MISNSVKKIREEILKKLPEGVVIPQHTEREHFYKVPSGKVYPSVTGKLNLIKDPSIANWKMNQSLSYIEQNFYKYFPEVDKPKKGDIFEPKKVLFTPDNLWKMIENAKKKPVGIFEDAGNIGTQIHDRRENYFNDWIKSGQRPDIKDYYDVKKDDPRLVSGMRGIFKFCEEKDYTPVVSEMLVYSDKYKVAGTLDDIGIIRIDDVRPQANCSHSKMTYSLLGQFELPEIECPDCEMKYHYDIALCDLKTSNQFKSSYHFQVAMYYMMFVEITDIIPVENFILKTSKENGEYLVEKIHDIEDVVDGAQRLLEFSKINDLVNKNRKKKDKKVITIN